MRKGEWCAARKGGGKFYCLGKINKLASFAFYYFKQQTRRASLPFPTQPVPAGGLLSWQQQELGSSKAARVAAPLSPWSRKAGYSDGQASPRRAAGSSPPSVPLEPLLVPLKCLRFTSPTTALEIKCNIPGG